MAVVRIFELAFDGHHLVYVRLIAEAMKSAGHSVVLVTRREALVSQEFEDNLAAHEWITLAPVAGGVLAAETLATALASSEEDDEVLVVPNADPHLVALLRSRLSPKTRQRVVALVMRPQGPGWRDGIIPALKVAVKRAVTRTLSCDSEGVKNTASKWESS